MDYSCIEIAKMIDHSLLLPSMNDEELTRGIEEALFYDVASVCIMPYYLSTCSYLLRESTIKASTTIGFPHGGHTRMIKLAEVKKALEDGGEELDMVVNISKVLSNDWNYVEEEIKAATELVHEKGQKIKIIFENCYLGESHKMKLCEICGSIGVDWVKTSTGFASGGATVQDVGIMRKVVGSQMGVKASGGIRDT